MRTGFRLSRATLLPVALSVLAVMWAQTAQAMASKGGAQISTQPSLYPAFDPAVTDYVTRCAGTSPVTVSVNNAPGVKTAVDGGPERTGSFSQNVALGYGQGFSLTIRNPAQPATRYFIRCVPPDVPGWTSSKTGNTQAEYYLTAPINGSSFSNPAPRNYTLMFDNNGVPVWWMPSSNVPVYATVLPNKDIGIAPAGGPAEEHRLDGSLVRTIAGSGGPVDFHELVQMPNGNFLVAIDGTKCCFDLTSWGGPTGATVYDQIIQEVKPDGTVVWSWSTADHISPDQTDPQWRQTALNGGSPYDIYHLNSLEADGDNVLVSYRHLDAVFDISRTTDAINWKVGGSPMPQSFIMTGDPAFANGGGFGGQHDARVTGFNEISIHDNGSGRGRAPRAVRYHLDFNAHTATLIDSVSDPAAPSSFCCGSARHLPGGDWVASWGSDPIVTELSPSGSRLFRLDWASGYFSYRAVPVMPGTFTRDALRAAMNAQYPR